MRERLEALRAQAEVARAYEEHLTDTGVLLGQLREHLEAIEREDDFDAKRRIVELLVVGIVVETEGAGAKKKARVCCRYAFARPEHVAEATSGLSIRFLGV